ncbi:MAG TPA: M20/M25/M40 family metallo-hydrolase [Streptosporangiaceae bacterium]|nr:M20/M25/M40 family metallo-hydrolase [Streptosporangiaceae bacterium]HVB44681.1 M20/M25/M40 family metallo-hydrolase [Streptosporangiaceae bacterium]
MTGTEGAVINTLQAAREDHDAVVKLTREMVRIPSRGGIDSYDPVLECMAAWLGGHGLACRQLAEPEGTTVALTCEVDGGKPGPRYVLDACLDTAPFGDETAWAHPPVSGEITAGWLHGRGSSDSKAGAAIFAHVAARLQDSKGGFSGSVVLLFDVDEHTGGFGGARAYFEGTGAAGRVDGVMIGYPGLGHVVTGGRGVLRARVRVHGVAGHSGSSRTGAGAVAKAAHLISALNELPLPGPAGPDFPLPAKLTVTAVSGGEGYSMVPDLCTFNVDIRLTPALDDAAAATLLRTTAAGADAAWPGTPPTDIEITTRWPPFALPDSSPLRGALLEAAAEVGLAPAAKVAGPSNIGNYLAGLGIPATAGFGVDYRDLHGTDERIRLDSIPLVQATYHQALLSLLQPA